MGRLRTENIFGSTEIDLSDGPAWKVTNEEPRKSDERARLEREVVEKAKQLQRLSALHGRYVAPQAIDDAAVRYREAETTLFATVTLLNELETQ